MGVRNVFDAIGLFLAQLVADIFRNSRTLALRVGQQIRGGHDGSAGQNALARITQFRHRLTVHVAAQADQPALERSGSLFQNI